MSEEKDSFVKFEDGMYNVYSEKGRRFGSYKTRKEANRRLAQMEVFKRMKKIASEASRFEDQDGPSVSIPHGGLRLGLFGNDLTQVMTKEDAEFVKKHVPYFKRTGPGLLPTAAIGAVIGANKDNIANFLESFSESGSLEKAIKIPIKFSSRGAVLGGIGIPAIAYALTRMGKYNKQTLKNAPILIDKAKKAEMEKNSMEKEALGLKAKAALVAAGMLGTGAAGYGLGVRNKKKKVGQAEKAGEFVGSIKTLEALGYGMPKTAEEEFLEKLAGKEHWIQKAVPESNKGLLHKKLGVPEGEKIPESKLKAAEKSGDPKLEHEARFAENVKGLHKKAYDELVEKIADSLKEALSPELMGRYISAGSKALTRIPAELRESFALQGKAVSAGKLGSKEIVEAMRGPHGGWNLNDAAKASKVIRAEYGSKPSAAALRTAGRVGSGGSSEFLKSHIDVTRQMLGKPLPKQDSLGKAKNFIFNNKGKGKVAAGAAAGFGLGMMAGSRRRDNSE